eukprot:8849551-Prorocentrum_lima.AAC.1
MTSSLVGSEMCIRDSANMPTRKGTARRYRLTCMLDLDLAHHASERNPVSYTHLTLPTICSV